MNTVKTIGLLIASALMMVMVAPVCVWAQPAPWIIESHSLDLDQLKREIQNMITKGYVPEGMTYDGNALYLLYTRDPNAKLEAWWIEWYGDGEALKSGLNQRLNEGYSPESITAAEDQIFVLYLKDASVGAPTEWILIPSGDDWEDIEKSIQPEFQKGYVPVGIAFLGDLYFTLLIKVPDWQPAEWMISEFKTPGHGKEIDAAIDNGFWPVGIEFDPGSESIDVLFLKE